MAIIKFLILIQQLNNKRAKKKCEPRAKRSTIGNKDLQNSNVRKNHDTYRI